MYNKIKSIQKIVEMELNMHRFFIPNSYQEFINVLIAMKNCTIRTDHAFKTENLPFYIYDTADGFKKAEKIWSEAETEEYKLIISDGIKYDNIQEYNMVVKIDKRGEFIFEASEMKIPLRHMYSYPLLSCSGNIADKVTKWEVYNQRYGINKLDIKRDLEELYLYHIFNKWLEITKYPIPVGVQNQKTIFWQVI